MSKERELLKQVLEAPNNENRFYLGNILIKNIKKLLAQPVPDSLTPRQGLEEYKKGYARSEQDLKREPLNDEEIDKGYEESDGNYYELAFRDGVRFAEKHYGIGE